MFSTGGIAGCKEGLLPSVASAGGLTDLAGALAIGRGDSMIVGLDCGRVACQTGSLSAEPAEPAERSVDAGEGVLPTSGEITLDDVMRDGFVAGAGEETLGVEETSGSWFCGTVGGDANTDRAPEFVDWRRRDEVLSSPGAASLGKLEGDAIVGLDR